VKTASINNFLIVFEPYFFAERTVTGIVYLDMLGEFLMPVLEEQCSDDMLFQQEGELPHFHKEVTDVLNSKFPEKVGHPVP
jgi:hypothetical protein